MSMRWFEVVDERWCWEWTVDRERKRGKKKKKEGSKGRRLTPQSVI